MEHLNLFIAQIAIIFLPGIIWARLDDRYASTEKKSDLDFLIRTFVYGVVTYVVTFVLYLLLNQPFSLIDFKAAQDRTVLTQTTGFEILAATGVGFGLGILWVYAARHKALTKFLQLIGATKRYGDEDVWDYTFNSSRAAVEYVHFRDFNTKIVYAGWVNTFSESEKLREIVLSDVQVYDFEGAFMYEVPLLYLARRPEDIHIEFPHP
jgi:uncharacterized membrane protein